MSGEWQALLPASVARRCGDPGWQLGVVLSSQANFYRVQVLDGDPEGYLCTCRSLLKKTGQIVMVGDWVEVSLGSGERGVIEAVRPRLRSLPRPAIANADQALVVMALSEPEPEPWGMSRFLIQAEASGLKVYVCFNKVDTVDPQVQQDWQARVTGWGYQPLFLSAWTGMGLEQLRQVCAEHISVLTGFSGVGKSSLLNALCPDLRLATQAVSGRLQHGRHTTRHVELFSTGSGWIADSPGFNRPDLRLCSSARLIEYFPEVRQRLGSCQFRDCLHQAEPGCKVRDPQWDRYGLYLSFLGEIQAQEQQETGDEDEGKKLLDPRYRRASRRQGRQRLNQDFLDSEETS